uniref:6-phosphogluconolactonase n=1 Tax=Brevundimonas sp. TaxID=1871086 RepID=UPI00390CD888
PHERRTLNLPWLAAARRVMLALTGANKRAVFEREAAGDPAVSPIAALIAANAPLEVIWTEAD